MEGVNESSANHYGDLLDRFRGLESSHQKLKEQFEILLQEKTMKIVSCNNRERDRVSDLQDTASFPGWANIPGAFFAGSPYKKVLEQLGHAVYVNRIGSGEIIYWNAAAEKLFGYLVDEVVGRSIADIRIDGEHHSATLEIIKRLSNGQSWSGQLPLRKRSRQIFMAIVTKSPYYEDGELVGLITVSSDAAIFNQKISGNIRKQQQDADEQANAPRVNFKKIQWQTQPRIAAVPNIASSVSNLASKVLSLRRGDTTTCSTTTEDRDAAEMESHDAKPRAPASKFFSKLQTKVRNTLEKVPGNNIIQNGLADNLKRKDAVCETCYERDLMKTKSGVSILDTTNHADSLRRGAPCDVRRPGSNFQIRLDGKEFRSNAPNIKLQELEEASSPTQPDSRKSPTSRENAGSGHGNSLNRIDSDLPVLVNSEIRWEDLQFREEIGQGSFAVVYRGIWNGSDVAVKVYYGNQYSEETLLGYKKEINIMRRLRHPNVLLFMGAVCTEERLAIVTEYMIRGSLFKTLHKNSQSLDIRRRLKMAIDVAKGMNYLHRRNPPIVHRDLKSSNLLVDKSWTVKVGDFGLSKLKHATFLTTRSGRGTPQWMAPEVLRNEHSTEKSDVFSFGVVLWELMTERIPWCDLNSVQVVGAVGFMDRRLDLPESMDPRVSSIISDCWQSKPEDRPSFEDIIHRLTELVNAGAKTTSAP